MYHLVSFDRINIMAKLPKDADDEEEREESEQGSGGEGEGSNEGSGVDDDDQGDDDDDEEEDEDEGGPTMGDLISGKYVSCLLAVEMTHFTIHIFL
ncbi:hypothetical protein EON65_07990 [archaeon]|nr:MAG: hypothetical protein EON65_07990 [archaeon]